MVLRSLPNEFIKVVLCVCVRERRNYDAIFVSVACLVFPPPSGPMFAVVPRNELPKLYSVCKRRNYKVGRVGSPLNNV